MGSEWLVSLLLSSWTVYFKRLVIGLCIESQHEDLAHDAVLFAHLFIHLPLH